MMFPSLSLHRGRTRNSVSLLGYSMSSLACVLGLSLLPSAARAQAVYMPDSTANPTSFISATYNVGGSPQGVAVADLNRDGKPDGIVADGTANQISVILSSTGAYTVTPYSTPAGSNPVAVAIVPNFSNSGLPAVAVAEQGAGTVAVYTDLANGTLTLKNTYNLGSAPTGIVVADFNNDGIPDIAVSYSTGVSVLLGQADGSFLIGMDTGVGSIDVALAAGHFDTSSNMDLAVVDQGSNKVDILVGDGTGGFSVSNSYTVGKLPTSIAVADLNNDGNVDIAVGNYSGNSVSILLGTGSDTFAPSSASPFAAGNNVQGVVINDVNGDGIPDVVVTNATQSGGGSFGGGNSLSVLIGTGNGNFSTAVSVPFTGSPYGLATIDSNRDGKPDIIVTQSTAGTASVLLNNTLLTPLPGGRNLQAPTQVGSGNLAVSVGTADFNHDGFQDAAVAYFEDNTVGVMLGNGNGTFRTQTTYSVGQQPYALAVADVNHDGYADIVTANEHDGTVSVLLNGGAASPGTFSAAPGSPFTVGKLPTGVAIGDINGDGFPDLAVANFGSNDVSILLGDGKGGFSPASTPTVLGQSNPYNVVMGDFNGDGKLDLAFTNKMSNSVSVYLGNGDGTFNSAGVLSTNLYPTSIVVGDFNRDGNLDIAVGDSIANNISLFLGKGDGTFQAQQTVTTLNFPVSMAVGDMNNDGIPDIVNVNPNYCMVTVLLGNGDGTFQKRWQYPTIPTTTTCTKATQNPGQQPWGVALADFNGDGKLDVVTANNLAQYNLTTPAYEPALGTKISSPGPASTSVLLNNSGAATTLSISPTGSLAYNQPVTMTDTVTQAMSPSSPSPASPTGSVEFEDTDGTELGIAPINLSNGGASLTLQNMGSGQHTISTLYSGDVNFQPNTVVGGNIQVQVQGTPVTIVANPTNVVYASCAQTGCGNPLTGGWNISVNVNDSSGTPANVPVGQISVCFYTPSGAEYYVNFGTSNGANGVYSQGITQTGTDTAGYSFTLYDPSLFLTPGVYEFYAIYNGNNPCNQTGTPTTAGNDPTGSSSNEQFTITPDPTTTSVSCTGPDKTGTMTCTATVTSVNNGNLNVSGTVNFSIDGGAITPETLAAGNPSGTATFQFVLPTGDSDSDNDADEPVTANYLGNSTFLPSSGTWTPPTSASPDILDINTGGAAAGTYVADEYYSAGNEAATTAAINTAGVANPAPQAVYQSERWYPTAFNYVIPGLQPGMQFTVVLQFAEIYFTGPNERQFNVLINGSQVLTNFDIFAAAGGENIAIAKTFTATADSNGNITIAFTPGAYNNPKISGIQIQAIAPVASFQSRPMATSSSTGAANSTTSSTTNSTFQPHVFQQQFGRGGGTTTRTGNFATIQPANGSQSGNAGAGNAGGSGSGTPPPSSPHRLMTHTMAP